MAKHFINNKDESVPMFDSAFLNLFSRVHFSVPLFIYVPVAFYFLYQTIFVYKINIVYVFLLFIVGLGIWTFTEYNLHRFLFHWMPPGKIGKRLHFIFHGVHHDYPRDSYRLVMVPTVSLPLAFAFYFLFQFIFGQLFGNPNFVAPFFVGFVVGYLFYDMSHYALHHVNFKSKFMLDLKQHHMIHHYQEPEKGFGVSTKFWDHVYRTMFKRKTLTGTVVVEENQ